VRCTCAPSCDRSRLGARPLRRSALAYGDPRS
jgi:hypothetical protein